MFQIRFQGEDAISPQWVLYQQISQNDVGIRTDVLDGCPKVEGMMRLIRSMAPRVLAVDEVGSLADAQALQMAGGCGCKLLATIHGGSMEEVKQKDYMCYIMKQRMFERYVMLDRRQGASRIVEIYDGEESHVQGSRVYMYCDWMCRMRAQPGGAGEGKGETSEGALLYPFPDAE